MTSRIFPLFAAILVLAGCATIPGTGGISGYYANQPNGTPRFRITQTISGYQMSVLGGEGWTPARSMKSLSTNDEELKAIPWFDAIVEAAWSIDGFTFLKFKSGAELAGQKLPTSYALAPGGFAYRVPATGSKPPASN